MRSFKAAFEQHYIHGLQAKKELEREDVGTAKEAEKTWLLEIGLIATLFFLVAFSQENGTYIHRHEGEDEKVDRACQERPRRSSNRSGPHGRPKGRGRSRNPRNGGRSSAGSRGRGRSRSPRNGGASSAGSRQRHLPQDQQQQQQKEPALWMAARAGDTEKCEQLLAAGAEVHT